MIAVPRSAPHVRFLLVLAALAAAAPAGAQERSVAALLAAAPATGRAQLAFPAREGVCGDGRGTIEVGGATIGGWGDADRRDQWVAHGVGRPCEPGPVRVVLALRDRRVEGLRTYVGDAAAPPRDTDVADLGLADPVDASRWLLDLAAHGDGRVAERALLPAVLAARAEPWPALLAIARDSATRSRAVRTTAGFWLARFAASTREGRRNSLVTDGDAGGERDDVKGQAVFALAQLPRREGIPALLDVARGNRDPGVRASAMFWLGQSGDPRAYAYFEEVLSGVGRR